MELNLNTGLLTPRPVILVFWGVLYLYNPDIYSQAALLCLLVIIKGDRIANGFFFVFL